MPARLIILFSATFIAIGVALLVQTVRVGGGIGYLLGLLFVALGVGRLVLLRSRRGEA